MNHHANVYVKGHSDGKSSSGHTANRLRYTAAKSVGEDLLATTTVLMERRPTVCKADGMFDGNRNTVQQSVARRWIQDDNRDIRLLDSAVTVSITHSAVRI